jgi:flagellar hook-associated protein 2
LADATKYDAATKKGSIMQGDSMTLSLQSALRSMMGSSSSGSTSYKTLSAVGVERQTDGSLKINATKMTAALANLSELKKLFTTDTSDSSTTGFALKVRDFSRGLVAFDGRVTSRATGIQTSISKNSADQARVSERADRVESALRKQYSALDTKMSQMNGLSSYVTSQIAQWNKSS